jgi:E3 ubiquitin-protein ligase TRIP12
VFFEIDAFASRDISVKTKEKNKDQEEPAPEVLPPILPPPLSVASIPGFKKISSLSLDPEDAITLRARVIKFRYITDNDGVNEDSSFESLKDLVGRLGSPQADEGSLSSTLKSIADLFASPQTSISSFELLQSGLVDTLLQYATGQEAIGVFVPFRFLISVG